MDDKKNAPIISSSPEINEINLSEVKINLERGNFDFKYNERISRMLLVIGTFSLVSLLFQGLWQILKNVCNTFYVNSNVPFGTEHILIPILLSDVALIFFASVFYCFSELYNFTNYMKEEYNTKYQITADERYKKLLGILIICITLTIVTTLITMTIFVVTDNTSRLIIILGFSFAILVFILLDRNKLVTGFKDFSFNFKLNKFSIISHIILWFFLSLMFLYLGSAQVDYSERSHAIFKFDSQNTLNLDIQFDNKIPKEIVIQSDAQGTTPIRIEDKEFFMTYVEATKENFNKSTDLAPATNQFIYKQSFYEYHHKTNIDKLLQQGKNTIIITFKVDGVPNTKKSYKIINQINNINGKYELFKQDFEVSLD